MLKEDTNQLGKRDNKMKFEIRSKLAMALSLVMMMSPLAPVQAQDSGTTAGDTLDMGQPVDRQPGTLYVDEVFDDWSRRCTVNPDGEDPCHLYQLLKDGEGNPTMEFSIIKLPDGLQAAAGATAIAPLQTLLTQQVTIQVDSGQAKRYPFKFCTQIGCIAQIGLTKAEIAAFKKGNKATVSIVPAGAPDQRVNLELSLKGFTAGFDSLHPGGPRGGN